MQPTCAKPHVSFQSTTTHTFDQDPHVVCLPPSVNGAHHDPSTQVPAGIFDPICPALALGYSRTTVATLNAALQYTLSVSAA